MSASLRKKERWREWIVWTQPQRPFYAVDYFFGLTLGKIQIA